MSKLMTALTVALVALLATEAFAQQQISNLFRGPDARVLTIPDEPKEALVDGFQAASEIVLLRARALDTDWSTAQTAIEQLGEVAKDRVSAELLLALARNSDEERAHAAAAALIEIAERTAELGHKEFAGSIGEFIYLSSHAPQYRSRAYPLFMLLDTERARRHGR